MASVFRSSATVCRFALCLPHLTSLTAHGTVAVVENSIHSIIVVPVKAYIAGLSIAAKLDMEYIAYQVRVSIVSLVPPFLHPYPPDPR